MSDFSVPFWVYLGMLPLWGTPVYIVYWALRTGLGRPGSKAFGGLLRGLAAWLAATAAYFIASFMISPCLEGCSKFDTPWHNAAQFALMLIYAAVAVVIVMRLHRSARAPVPADPGPDRAEGNQK